MSFIIGKLSNGDFVLSGSSASGSSRKDKDKSGKKSSSPAGSGSDTDTVASARRGPASENIPPPGTLGVPPDVSGSRQSFRMAMGNPCEFFVDVM